MSTKKEKWQRSSTWTSHFTAVSTLSPIQCSKHTFTVAHISIKFRIFISDCAFVLKMRSDVPPPTINDYRHALFGPNNFQKTWHNLSAHKEVINEDRCFDVFWMRHLFCRNYALRSSAGADRGAVNCPQGQVEAFGMRWSSAFGNWKKIMGL